jgi:hypothetical protein
MVLTLNPGMCSECERDYSKPNYKLFLAVLGQQSVSPGPDFSRFLAYPSCRNNSQNSQHEDTLGRSMSDS